MQGKPALITLIIGNNSDIACSQTSTWADEALAELKLEMTDDRMATTLDVLCAADNKGEKRAMRAGRKYGVAAAERFDRAWTTAKESR
jgi:hypothetical protein